MPKKVELRHKTGFSSLNIQARLEDNSRRLAVIGPTMRLSVLLCLLTAIYGPGPAAYSASAEGNRAFNEGVRIYQSGNPGGAIKYFEKAFQLGDLRGGTQIGYQYETGDGVSQDYKLAAQWYLKAAQAGESQSMKNIGNFYEDGKGVAQDWVSAANWYKKAAERGNADGEYELGEAYQFGTGVPMSRQNALHWYQLAMQHGSEKAKIQYRHLKSSTNFAGFRDEQERALVLGNQLRTSSEFINADPTGTVFHNPKERLSWLRGLRQRVDADEAEQRRQRDIWDQEQHESEVSKLMREGYSRSEAERRARR